VQRSSVMIFIGTGHAVDGLMACGSIVDERG